MDKNAIEKLNKEYLNKRPEEILSYFISNYENKIVFASSMGAEDQVLTHMIVNINKETPIFTLDTGRLFPETYDIIARTNARFGIKINVYFPEKKQIEEMVTNKGINLFYESIENRKLCCNTRKIEPLKRAFSGMDVWICGLRKDQSVTRHNNQIIEWDEENGMIKVNPILNWSMKNVWDFIKKNNVPYNKLHDKGFPSIGCQPCTRAIEPGEDIRAGRWWWENPDMKECGLHNQKNANKNINS
jgi:phosphoadenosine phosphosulfate reductase